MTIVVNMGGGCSWANTRKVLVTSTKWTKGAMDFGAGAERTATCPKCNRTLPAVCMHIDHIKSKAEYGLMFMAPDEVHIVDPLTYGTSTRWKGKVEGGVVTIMEMGTAHSKPVEQNTGYGPIRRSGGVRFEPYSMRDRKPTLTGNNKVISTEQAWKNDLENLQFLCMGCNTSKNKFDLDEDDVPQPFVQ